MKQLPKGAGNNVPAEIGAEDMRNSNVNGRLNFSGRRQLDTSSVAEDDESSSSCNSDDLRVTNEENDEGDSFDQQCQNGFQVMKLARQLKLYKSSKQDEICTDTLQCIQRYTRKIFRQVS